MFKPNVQRFLPLTRIKYILR